MKRNSQYAAYVALFLAILLTACAGPAKVKKDVAISPVPAKTTSDTTKALEKPVKDSTEALDSAALNRLSDATKLLLNAIDNYVQILPNNKKTPEVIMIKGHTFYNNRMYGQARQAYEDVISKFGKTPEVPEAIKMTAQTYYEENRYDEAQSWYKKLKEIAVSGEDKEEAAVRLAESYYKLGEKFKELGNLNMAAEQFERVVIEFPNSKIADAALYNAAMTYEYKKEWSTAILSFNKLIANYGNSEFIEKCLFSIAKCYEQMSNWSKAALTYVEIFRRFPSSAHVKDALYNASLAYEKEENFLLAARMYEKYAETWPKDKDSPDVLFKAGELYGKLEDWGNVERINGMFGSRYGNDKDRIVMAQCMTGIASYMQKKYDKALIELEKSIVTGKQLGFENKVNAFYSAKAQFTIGEINQEKANQIALILPESEYQSRLKQKINFMDAAVTAFTKVSTYKLIEWTTKSIYRIGETYEQFGVSIFKRERPKNMAYQKMLAMEEGIANAVEQYLVEKALSTHEQNMNFGIQYKYEDEWIARSRQQLTKLPYLAAMNYSKLIQAANVAPAVFDSSNPMKMIQKKLELLQNVAPFQDKAIALFLKTLEMAAKYGVEDKYRTDASSEVTRMSYDVGNTYAEVVSVARSAPIPASYDEYKKFFYKVHLLGEGLVEYENNAISALYKNIKIGEAYSIKDEWIKKSKEKLSEVLFTRSLCYEILAEQALRTPPIPPSATEAEIEEFKLQFEELGYKLQDEAFTIYRDIYKKGEQGLTTGPYLDMTYIRLYTKFPNEVGKKIEKDSLVFIRTDKEWSFSLSMLPDWMVAEGSEISGWKNVSKGMKPDSINLTGFSEPLVPVWGGAVVDGKFKLADEIYLRKEFKISNKPVRVSIEYAATGHCEIFINKGLVASDSINATTYWNKAKKKEGFVDLFKPGKNVIAVHIKNTTQKAKGLFLLLNFEDKMSEILPKLPSMEKPITIDELKKIRYEYPMINNFEYKPDIFKTK